MSVHYKAAPKGYPGVVGGGDIKYYATIARNPRVTLREFLEEMSELNTAHPGAVLAVLETFFSRVNWHLVNGRGVELGQLGTFYPSITSTGHDNPEDVRKESVKRFKVIFRPSAILKDKLSHVKLIKIADDTVSVA